jgi:hypothetical protein
MGGIYPIQPQGLDAGPEVRPTITETSVGSIRLTGEPLQIKPKTVPKTLKRGRAYRIEWNGDIPNDMVHWPNSGAGSIACWAATTTAAPTKPPK